MGKPPTSLTPLERYSICSQFMNCQTNENWDKMIAWALRREPWSKFVKAAETREPSVAREALQLLER